MKNLMFKICFVYSLEFLVFAGKSESKDSPDKEKSDPPKTKPVKTPSNGGMYI
jgi:hypothetical protein